MNPPKISELEDKHHAVLTTNSRFVDKPYLAALWKGLPVNRLQAWMIDKARFHHDGAVREANGQPRFIAALPVKRGRGGIFQPSGIGRGYTPNLRRYPLGETPVCRWKIWRKKAAS